jgi:hypothetical protein
MVNMGYTRQAIEDSITHQKYDDVQATYLLLGRRTTDVCISAYVVTNIEFCLVSIPAYVVTNIEFCLVNTSNTLSGESISNFPTAVCVV